MAVLVASFLIGLVYSVYIRASKTFRVQNMILEMQSQARFGLEHLRNDFANAGFGGTVNSAIDTNLCQPPPVVIRALTVKRSVGVVPNSGDNKFIEPLEFTLFGDYSGGGNTYFTESVIGNTIKLQDFTSTGLTEAEFDKMFSPDNNSRYVRLLDKEQYEIIRPIVSSSFGSRSITVGAPGIPERSGTLACGRQGFGEGLEVNSAHFIRYRMKPDNRAGAAADKVDLVREEIQIDGKTPVKGSALIIAEHVVDLTGYDWAFDDDVLGTTPTISFIRDNTAGTIVNGSDAGVLGVTGSKVQNLRFVTLKLTVRTADEDPDMGFRARASKTAPIHTFDITPGLEGSARTLSMTTKVMLQTLAYRNVKGVVP